MKNFIAEEKQSMKYQHKSECLEVMYEELKIENERLKSEIIQFQIPMLVITEQWEPSKCPRCKESFYNYEPCNDGYYHRAYSIERCPYCGQKLKWK